jgi:hypothetical protein
MYLFNALVRLFRGPAPVPTSQHPATPVPQPAEVVKFDKPPADVTNGFVPSGAVDTAAQAFSAVTGAAGDIAGLARQAVAVTRAVETVLDKGLGAGEGRASLAALGAPAIVAVGAAQLTRKGLEAIGVKDKEVIKTAEQAVAAGPFAPAVLMAHGASAVLRAVSPEADRAVRDVVKLADITDPKQPAGKLFQAVTSGVKDLLGGKEAKPPPPPATAQQVAAVTTVLEARGQTMASAGIGGLLSAARQVQQSTPPPATPPVPPGPLAPFVKTTSMASRVTGSAGVTSPLGLKTQLFPF